MKYEIKWEYSTNSSNQKKFQIKCELTDHPSIKSFWITIEERNSFQNLKYDFWIEIIEGKTTKETNKTKQSVIDNFVSVKVSKNVGASIDSFSLFPEVKESALDCATVLLRLITLNDEDQSKIMNFIQTGIFTPKQLFEIILDLINQCKIQEAYDKASSSEKQGYKGIMFQVATTLSERNYFQPAYLSFASVPPTDEKFMEAQISAAKLATKPEVSFPGHPERLKTIFTHCQNAGELGQPFIDNYFMHFTRLNEFGLEVKNVGTNFETLANLGNIIAQQNSVIAKQNEEIEKLRKQLAERDNKSNANYPFFSDKSSDLTPPKP